MLNLQLREYLCLGAFLLVQLFGPIALAQDPPSSGLDPYEVKPGDTLEISVWKEPDLQKEVLVRPDGMFSFPLVGEVIAHNRSVSEIQGELRSALVKYIPDLVVTVTVTDVSGNKIYVIGQVNKAGEFIVNPMVDVMQALSMAGGTTPFASLNDIKILRRDNDQLKALSFRYDSVVKGRDLEQNVILHSGDVIVVP